MEADRWAPTTVQGGAGQTVWTDSNLNGFNQFKFLPSFYRSEEDLSVRGKFGIKNGFEGFEGRNNFVYRNFFKFEVDFEWNFRKTSRHEFE
jgi:hypothetical protein